MYVAEYVAKSCIHVAPHKGHMSLHRTQCGCHMNCLRLAEHMMPVEDIESIESLCNLSHAVEAP